MFFNPSLFLTVKTIVMSFGNSYQANSLSLTINNSYATGDVTGSSKYVGGLVGYSSGSSSSSSSSSSNKGQRTCSQCNGTGQVIKSTTGFGNRKWCSICGKEVADSHYHGTCPGCNGTGKW